MAPVPPAMNTRTGRRLLRPLCAGEAGAGGHPGRDLGLWQDVKVSEDSGYPGAPPGWYPDPAGGPGQRWWDGYAWSEAVVLPQPAPPPPWTGAPPPQGP